MDKYTSGAFASTKYGIYKSAQDIITSFPATVIGNGSNVSSWTIKGNMTSNAACGDKTANLFDKNNANLQLVDCGFVNGVYTLTSDRYIIFIPVVGGENYSFNYAITASIELQSVFSIDKPELDMSYKIDGVSTFINHGYVTSFTRTAPQSANWMAVQIYSANNLNTNIMITHSTAPLTYEPYGYKIPILWGNNTYPIYLSEPLRKSRDSSNLYDTIDSNGTLTRRVDSSGDSLVTPTTEQIEVPTLITTTSALTFDIDTTLKPSEVSLTYIGWHLYNDKKYTSGAWS